MKFKKTIATITALGLLLALSACGRPGAEINWGSSSIAGRVENISGSTVTLTLGVITSEPGNTGNATAQNSTATPDNGGTLGQQKPDESGMDTTADNPADAGQNGNTAEDSGTGTAGAENSSGTDNTIGEQQDAAGGVSFGDGGAGEDYTAPDATATPNSGTAGENQNGAESGAAAAGRFVAGDTTIRITLNNHGLLSMMGIDGASTSAKLEDLKVGDIVTIDHDSRGGIGGIVMRRDIEKVV